MCALVCIRFNRSELRQKSGFFFDLLKLNKFSSNSLMNQYDTHILYTDLKFLNACDRLSQSGFDARAYGSPELAMYDVIQSIIQYMPHKNKIAVIARGSHLVETVVALALKNQNQVVYKKDTESTMAFLESLDANTHCVYWCAEHEITGEVYYSKKEYAEMLATLNRKKIFSVQVTASLSPQALNELQINETSGYSLIVNVPSVFKYRSYPSLVFYADKVKIQFMLALLQNNTELNKTISEGKGSFLATQSQYQDQLVDRVVITTEKVSAQAVKEFLKLDSEEAFVATDYPSWITDKWLLWWPELERPKTLQNTLILSKKYIDQHPDYMVLINQAESQIVNEAQWKV